MVANSYFLVQSPTQITLLILSLSSETSPNNLRTAASPTHRRTAAIARNVDSRTSASASVEHLMKSVYTAKFIYASSHKNDSFIMPKHIQANAKHAAPHTATLRRHCHCSVVFAALVSTPPTTAKARHLSKIP